MRKATQVKNRYLSKFDELNILETEIMKLSDKEQIEKYFNEILYNAYIEGFSGVEFMLETELDLDYERLLKSIRKEYDGITIQQKAVKYVQGLDVESIKNLLESEWHRVYNEAQNDGALLVDKEILKEWNTVGDNKVRETHTLLDGVEIGLNERFYTIDGDNALYPSGFEKAENNCNCRCFLGYKIK